VKKDEKGQAFVEATILFPIMIMIFAALVLLSIYLPTRGALQRATQHAAVAIATVESDTWIFFDESAMSHYWENSKYNLPNVYVALFSGMGDIQALGESIVIDVEGRNLSSMAGELTVKSYVIDRIVYKEIIISATREFPIPIDLSFVSFPRAIPVTATSTAVVVSGGEFMRNVDMAIDFSDFIFEKFGLTNLSENIGTSGAKIRSLLGW